MPHSQGIYQLPNQNQWSMRSCGLLFIIYLFTWKHIETWIKMPPFCREHFLNSNAYKLLNESVWISLKSVPQVPIDAKSALFPEDDDGLTWIKCQAITWNNVDKKDVCTTSTWQSSQGVKNEKEMLQISLRLVKPGTCISILVSDETYLRIPVTRSSIQSHESHK